jgi:hypothetical protein
MAKTDRYPPKELSWRTFTDAGKEIHSRDSHALKVELGISVK